MPGSGAPAFLPNDDDPVIADDGAGFEVRERADDIRPRWLVVLFGGLSDLDKLSFRKAPSGRLQGLLLFT